MFFCSQAIDYNVFQEIKKTEWRDFLIENSTRKQNNNGEKKFVCVFFKYLKMHSIYEWVGMRKWDASWMYQSIFTRHEKLFILFEKKDAFIFHSGSFLWSWKSMNHNHKSCSIPSRVLLFFFILLEGIFPLHLLWFASHLLKWITKKMKKCHKKMKFLEKLY